MALNAERPLFHNQILFHLLPPPPSLLSSRTIAWATLHAILFRLIVQKWYRFHDKRRTMLNLRPRPGQAAPTAAQTRRPGNQIPLTSFIPDTSK